MTQRALTVVMLDMKSLMIVLPSRRQFPPEFPLSSFFDMAIRRSSARLVRRATGREPGRNNEITRADNKHSSTDVQHNGETGEDERFPGWTRVYDEQTGMFYYWHKPSNITTHLGEEPPTPRSAASMLGGTIAQSAAIGAGMAFAFGLVRVLIG